MRELNNHDLERIRRMLPKEVRAVLKDHNDRPFLAGGFIRSVIAGEEPADIDLFVSNKEAGNDLVENIRKLMLDYRAELRGRINVIKTDNAYTVLGLKYPIQVIHRWTFDNPQKCIESFDFTIASAAVYWGNAVYGQCHSGPTVMTEQPQWRSCCDDSFYEDLAAKRLVYRNPVRNEDAGGSILRLLKFYRKGYTAPLKPVAEVIARMDAGVNQERMREGMPKSQVYLGLLREVDPLVLGAVDADTE